MCSMQRVVSSATCRTHRHLTLASLATRNPQMEGNARPRKLRLRCARLTRRRVTRECARDSLLTTHHSLLITHYSLPTTHYSLLTTHYSLLATCYSLLGILATYYLLPTNDYLPLATHDLISTAVHLSPTTYCQLLTAYYYYSIITACYPQIITYGCCYLVCCFQFLKGYS